MRTRYSLNRGVSNAFLVRERDQRRRRDLWRVALVVVPLAVALLVYTWVQLEVVEQGHRVETLQRQLDDLAESERLLELRATELRSLSRLELVAKEHLDLHSPTLDQMIFVESEGGP